jgi:L-malate glycosyltransferase
LIFADNKRICIVTPEFPPTQWGGLARTAEKVSRHVAGFGFSVNVVHLAVEDHPLVWLDENRHTRVQDGVTIHEIHIGSDYSSFPGYREIWDDPHNLTIQMMFQSLEMLSMETAFDAFHSFFLYPVGFVVGLLARKLGKPHLATIVGNDVNRYLFSPEKFGLCRSGLENSNVVVGLSRDLIKLASAATPVKNKSRIIYNSVDIPSEQWTPTKNKVIRIGCAGIFKYAKGLPYLLKAVESLSRDHPVSVELIGRFRDSEKESFNYMISRTGMEKAIVLNPHIPHEKIPEWLKNLDVFVLPSLTEGCPNILMEALAVGVPSVATMTGAASELIDHGVSGMLVPWGNSEALAKAVEKLILDREFAHSLGVEARKKMSEYSSHVEKVSWENAYRELFSV